MIKLDGQLTVKTINGRNGPFNVGRLKTDIGEFSAKSIRIEELPEGTYSGSFLIGRIYPSSYCAGGRVIAEIRIDINELFLSDEQPLPPTSFQSDEVDPLDEERGSAIKAKSRASRPTAASALPAVAETDDSAECSAAVLFGLLWPIGKVVALDPTVERGRLREQASYLKSHGYRYDFKNKLWNKG